MTISAVALFCEDVRDEASHQNTIVGTLPDNVILAGPEVVPAEGQAHFPKLAVYLRVNTETASKPRTLSAKVVDALGNTIARIDWTSSVIDTAYQRAAANKMPLVGFLFRMSAAPFPVVADGLIKAFATVDEVDYLAGAINVQTNPDPSAAAQPDVQSQPSS